MNVYWTQAQGLYRFLTGLILCLPEHQVIPSHNPTHAQVTAFEKLDRARLDRFSQSPVLLSNKEVDASADSYNHSEELQDFPMPKTRPWHMFPVNVDSCEGRSGSVEEGQLKNTTTGSSKESVSYHLKHKALFFSSSF